MLLSDQVFDGMIELLGTAVMTAGSGGQRREPRTLLDTRFTIIPCPDGLDAPHGPPLAVPVRDMSRGGLRFMLPRRLPLDTQFITLLPRSRLIGAPGNDETLDERHGTAGNTTSGSRSLRPLAVLTAVAYWQPLARDLYALGGEFVRVLSGIDIPAVEPRQVLVDLGSGQTAGQRAAG